MAEPQGSKDINKRKQRKKAAAQRKKQQQQQQVLEKGSEESESNSESDSEDDLLAFASGGKVSNKVEKETDEHRYESESARATRLIKEEYRREQSMLKKKEKKNALRELTLSNLGAAWYSENDGDEENLQGEPQQGGKTVFHGSLSEGQSAFMAIVEQGKSLILEGNLAAAVSKLEQGLPICAAFPEKVLWTSTLRMTLGTTLCKLGKVREGISHLHKGIGAIRAQEYTTFDSRPLQKQLLGALVSALHDIGKDADAERWERELEALGTTTTRKERTSSANDGGPLDPNLVLSLDQALESGLLHGQFGYLRAILHAFRNGRGGVPLARVVSHAHSQTGATPLMVAAAKGNVELIVALLMAGADTSSAANDNCGALEWAARFNQPAAVSTLLDHGIVFDSKLTPEILGGWSPEVQTAIAEYVNKVKFTDDEKDKKVEGGGEKKKWDQFEANKKLGAKETTFDENLYTTKLDVSSIPPEVQAKAAALASNMSQTKDGSDAVEDEEAAFAAVLEASKKTDDGWTDASVTNKKKNRKKKPNKA